MPSYEYICESCGYEFELVQRMSDPPRKLCPRCRKKVTRKVGKGAGIIFKGSGFYATDYRSSDYKAKELADRSGSPAPASGTKASKDSGGSKASKDAGGTKGEGKKS